jgi:UDP-N-acetylmuramoyl-L-alanyl-D-glutamate--2,6-diaminopimelate ligase
VIHDRKQAIEAAISGASSGDCVLIAGKGHEDYQEIAGVRLPFSDREVVLDLLKG